MLRAIAGPVDTPPAMPAAAAKATPVTGLHECPACRRDMVCPIDWRPVDDERWSIDLRCGECGLAREFVASNAQAADLEATLDTHQREIEHELGRLDAARMVEEVNAFVDALRRNLIFPADFA